MGLPLRRRPVAMVGLGCLLLAGVLLVLATPVGQTWRLRRASLETLERLLEKQPGWALAHYWRGERLAEMGRSDEALGAWLTAYHLDPNLEPALLRLGQALISSRPQRAVEFLQRLVRLRPRDAEAWYGLAVGYGRLKRVDDAIAALRRALALREEDPRFHREIAQLLLNRSQFEEAERHLQRALQLDPANPIAHYTLGRLLLLRNRLEEAEREVAFALAADPPLAEPYHIMGEICLRQGQEERALEFYRRALEKEPTYQEALYKMAQLCRRLGREKEAQRWEGEFQRVSRLEREIFYLEERVQNRPEDWEARLRLARFLMEANRLEEALGHLQFYLAHHPGDAQAAQTWESLVLRFSPSLPARRSDASPQVASPGR